MEAKIEEHDDLALRRVNIESWKSPVAEQFAIRSIPHLVIYDQRGKKVCEGDAALAELGDWGKPKAKAKPKRKTPGRKVAEERRRSRIPTRTISKGQKVDLRRNLVRGKYTIFEFYADW